MIGTRIYVTHEETEQMSNERDSQEAFPNGDYDPGFDYVALGLAVILALIIVTIVIALRIPLS